MASTLAPGVKTKLGPCPRCGPLETGAKKRSWGHGLAGAKSQLGAMAHSRPAPEDTVNDSFEHFRVKRFVFLFELSRKRSLMPSWSMNDAQATTNKEMLLSFNFALRTFARQSRFTGNGLFSHKYFSFATFSHDTSTFSESKKARMNLSFTL